MMKNNKYIEFLFILISINILAMVQTTEPETNSIPQMYKNLDKFINNDCTEDCSLRYLFEDRIFCQMSNFYAFCRCMKGFWGDPFDGCFVDPEVANPCDPNPCRTGECIWEESKDYPAHCKCTPDSHDCLLNVTNPCELNPCGENSVCRVDDNSSKFHCSCIDGYVPQGGIGCVKTTKNESEASTYMINNCGLYCGKNANCKIFNGKLECSCDESEVLLYVKPFVKCVIVGALPSGDLKLLVG